MDKSQPHSRRQSTASRLQPLVASIVVAAVLAGCAGQGRGTEATTEATPPTRNGEIAFARLDDQGRSGIFVVEADGTGLEGLPATPVGESPDPSPAWSPDGESIAFGAESPGGDGGFDLDIYVADADGGGLERVTTEPTFDSGPSWSRDGSRLAFSGVDMSQMFGSASASAGSARGGSDESGIHTIRSDGTDLHQLTTEPGDEHPAWSPDGGVIAFGRLTKAAGSIYTVSPDGDGPRKLTDPPEGYWDSQPSWTPNGAKIAFTRASESRSDVFLMNADGTGVMKLTGKSGDGFSPDFSPDGKQIVFTRNDEGQTTHIHVMDADGTDVRRLTKGVGIHDDAPDWRPLTLR